MLRLSLMPKHQDLKPGDTVLRWRAMALEHVRAVMMKVLTGCITFNRSVSQCARTSWVKDKLSKGRAAYVGWTQQAKQALAFL